MNQLRLHVIAEPSTRTERSFDIIAFHGPGGLWDRTWTSSNGSGWLRDVLPKKFASSRILSLNCPKVLQYFLADEVDVSNIISEIIYNRKQADSSETPIIFIGHSIGGILAKQIFVSASREASGSSDFQSLFECIRGFVWLGTPHKHVGVEDPGSLYRAFERGSERSLGGNVNCLRDVFNAIDNVNEEFRRLGGEALPACSFYERLKTPLGRDEALIVTKDQASYISRMVRNMTHGAIDLRHKDLGRLGDMKDANCRRVVSAIEDMFRVIESPTFSRGIIGETQNTGINVLSFDGGGVRGMFSLLVLEKLLTEVERQSGSHRQRRLPCEYFDLIGETSTGGLLAIMLGRLQMDISSCVQAYRNMSKGIFGSSGGIFSAINPIRHGVQALVGKPWFDGDKLKAAICQIVEQQTSLLEREDLEAAGFAVEDVHFLSSDALKTRCFVCAICEGHHAAERVRSYLPKTRRGRDTSSYTIWEAGRATSAAPMYFPAIQINGHYYFDGGLHCNNPILEVVDEARSEFPGTGFDAIVSIGTGRGNVAEPFAPLTNFVNSAIGRLTTTEHQHHQFKERPDFPSLEASYFRFQEMEDLGKIDLAAADKLGEIEELAREYLRDSEVTQQIAQCATRMIQSGRFR